MGIKKFTGTFIEVLQDMSDKAFQRVIAIFIDGNQFLYGVLELLRAKCVKDNATGNYTIDTTDDSFWQLLGSIMQGVYPSVNH